MTAEHPLSAGCSPVRPERVTARTVPPAPLACLVLLAGTAVPAGAVELRALRLSTGPEAAQLVLDLSDRIDPNIFTLKTPDRTVIDLGDTHLAPGVSEPRTGGIVTAVRLGHQPGGVLRVVLQLSAEYQPHPAWSYADSGPQLIINLGATEALAPRERGDGALPVADTTPVATSQALPEVPRPVAIAHAPAAGERDIIVAVDAGHGGVDPGALGRAGTREKDVTLAIATRLAARINAEPGMRAVLTRRTDDFVELRERILRARKARADMFISIHADSARNREASGASVYVLSEKGASNENARWLADHENAADLLGGVKIAKQDRTLASVLLDLSQTATISNSITAAQRVLASLDGVEEVRKSEVQQAGFVVLKSPDIPSLLVETAYISNPHDEARLRRPAEQQRLAEAIFAGVHRYFLASPPEGTRLATQAREDAMAKVVPERAP